MGKIRFSSSKSFAPLLKKWGTESFKIYHNSSSTEPKFISWKGKDDVVKTTVHDKNSSVLIIGNVRLPEDKKTFLSFNVGCAEDSDWELEIIIEEGLYYRSVMKEKINARTTINGWKEIEYDLSKYDGTEIEILIKQSADEIHKSSAYWNNLKIVSE
ncbi:MAG: hypothetical protein R3250_12380, partial [Melioribacteraceae bacterium]|nr:hypothetical protein [Melioribacteraceae bacterium]